MLWLTCGSVGVAVALQVKEISDNYLKLEEFQYENVDRASKACGPLNK
jgi:hypothetical protein